MSKLVTVIITVYNGDKFIDKMCGVCFEPAEF